MAAKDNGYFLITASQARDLDPAHSVIPPGDALKKLRAGHVVKVGIAPNGSRIKPELFWVIITHRTGSNFIGAVNNHLIRTEYHGVKYGDPLRFKLENIVNICFQQPDEKVKKPKSVRII
jgi:hypothetical protein